MNSTNPIIRFVKYTHVFLFISIFSFLNAQENSAAYDKLWDKVVLFEGDENSIIDNKCKVYNRFTCFGRHNYTLLDIFIRFKSSLPKLFE